MGGIFRPVKLIGRGGVGIRNVWTVSTISNDLKHADVSVKLELDPSQGVDGTVLVKCHLTEPKVGNNKPRVFEVEKSVAVSGKTPVELAFSIDNPMLWYPYEQGRQDLHVLEVEVLNGKELLDRNLSRVGIREVSFDDKQHCVHINHHRIFLKGMLNDDIHWMSMMDRTGYQQRIQLQKDANLNIIRMIAHQSSPDMYDLCDQMGMMIWQEMPLQWGYSSAEPIRKDIMSVVKETVTQTRPHASVVGWSAWNEGGQSGFTDNITSTIRELDNTRPMTRVSGGGDFDIHIYPSIIPAQMSRRCFFWAGIKPGFVSETGVYGMSSIKEMKEMIGDDLLPFDSADYYWDNFNSYRYNDGPIFWDAPTAADWPTEKIREYIISKAEPSQRWCAQFHKNQYETLRAQRFDPTTATIHCRFDDAFPSGYYGSVVDFEGRPRKAYYSVKEACQQVLPILFFGFNGVDDLRVVNEYWYRDWKGCNLSYIVKDRKGTVIGRREKAFDLPADTTVKVLNAEEIGDIYHIPGGFFVDLVVSDSSGKVISKNSYDITEEEIQAFLTSVYPVPPVKPIDSQVFTVADAVEIKGLVRKIDTEGTYSKTVLEFGEDVQPYLKWSPTISDDADYLVRVSCDSGEALRSFELFVDDKKAELENYPYTDMTLAMTRQPYSDQRLAWRPGWRLNLTKGAHCLEMKWPDGKPASKIIIDAICLQRISSEISVQLTMP